MNDYPRISVVEGLVTRVRRYRSVEPMNSGWFIAWDLFALANPSLRGAAKLAVLRKMERVIQREIFTEQRNQARRRNA